MVAVWPDLLLASTTANAALGLYSHFSTGTKFRALQFGHFPKPLEGPSRVFDPKGQEKPRVYPGKHPNLEEPCSIRRAVACSC
jgi:hypothetical protein